MTPGIIDKACEKILDKVWVPQEPLLTTFARHSLRIFSFSLVKFFGSSTLEWDTHSVRLHVNHPTSHHLLQWRIEQIIGSLGYGICCVWALTLGYGKLGVLRYVLNLVYLIASMTSGVILYLLWMRPEEIASSVNNLLDYHQVLMFRNRRRWRALEEATKLWILLFGIGLLASACVLSMMQFCPCAYVLLDLDTIHFILATYLEVEKLPSELRIFICCVQLVTMFLMFHCVCRNCCFLLFYNILILQAYIFSLKTIHSLLSRPKRVITEYRKFCLLHGALSQFSDSINSVIYGLGHTICVAFLWLVIKGGDDIPLFVHTAFVFVCLVASLSITAILKVISSIFMLSSALLQKLPLYRSNASFRVMKREVNPLRPIVCRNGSWFIISQISPAEFLHTLMTNLATVVLTF